MQPASEQPATSTQHVPNGAHVETLSSTPENAGTVVNTPGNAGNVSVSPANEDNVGNRPENEGTAGNSPEHACLGITTGTAERDSSGLLACYSSDEGHPSLQET